MTIRRWLIVVAIAAIVSWDAAVRPPAAPSYAIVGIHNESGSPLTEVRLSVSGGGLDYGVTVEAVDHAESRYLDNFPISGKAQLSITCMMASGRRISRTGTALIKEGAHGTVHFHVMREGIGFGYGNTTY
jgi:hypothetical protein